MRPARKAVYSCLCLADPGAVSSESFSHCGFVSLCNIKSCTLVEREKPASRGKKSEMSLAQLKILKYKIYI